MSDEGLGQFLERRLEPAVEESQPSFVVDDDAKATWAMLKLARSKKTREEAKAEAGRWRQLIDEWLAQVETRCEASASYFEGLLTGYLRRLRAEDDRPEDKRIKSKKLPVGTIGSRAGSTTINVTDPALFVAWAIDNQAWDLVTVTASKAGLAKLRHGPDGRLMADGEAGEVVPGVRYVEGERSYFVMPAPLPELAPAPLSDPLGSFGAPTREDDDD